MFTSDAKYAESYASVRSAWRGVTREERGAGRAPDEGLLDEAASRRPRRRRVLRFLTEKATPRTDKEDGFDNEPQSNNMPV